MNASILFIDSDHAKIFKLNPEKMESSTLKKHESSHHASADEKKDEHEKHFFTDVTSALVGTTELLIVGPGQAKNRFKAHLDTHHHQGLAQAVIGVETVDHPTDPQIIAVGKKFFKSYDLFH